MELFETAKENYFKVEYQIRLLEQSFNVIETRSGKIQPGGIRATDSERDFILKQISVLQSDLNRQKKILSKLSKQLRSET